MFERILVPLDGSARSEAILPQLDRLLRREDAEVVLFRAYPSPRGDAWADISLPSVAAERDAAEEYLHGVALRLARQGVKVHSRAAQGPPAASILEQADEQGATMIAMSTHGRTGLSRWLMGSVAEKVVRASRLPVLLVRSFRTGASGSAEPVSEEKAAFRKILVPTDGSRGAMAVVTAAEKFGQLYDSEIVVLHVRVPRPPSGMALPGMEKAILEAPLPPPEPNEATAPMIRRFEHAGLKVTRAVAAGDPAAEILDHGFASGVDLIALATHGRSGVSRWMLGSVAERVLRHASIPLLLVRVEKSPPKKRGRVRAAVRLGRR